MVNFFIANTDNSWFDFLSSQSNMIEVNFWQPGGKSFHAIQAGELFVFRLKSPRNKIGGYGVLSNSSILPLQMAWETFGLANGAATYHEFRDAIARYRTDETVGPTTNIGCRILTQPQFFEPESWVDLPASWSPNIMGGKRYSAESAEGFELWSRLQAATIRTSVNAPEGFAEVGPRYGAPTLITPRLGQGAFRVAVTEAYARKCAVTGGKVLPALDAAHIRPYADGGPHTKANGLLLRKDIHCVFDAGYATVDTDFKFVVSEKVKEVFNNGNEYRRLHGALLNLPIHQADRPEKEFLKWHNEKRFLG